MTSKTRAEAEKWCADQAEAEGNFLNRVMQIGDTEPGDRTNMSVVNKDTFVFDGSWMTEAYETNNW